MDTKSDRAAALWAPARISLAITLFSGVFMLGVGVFIASPTDGDELSYVGLALVFGSGLSLGGVLDGLRQRRMVHRHMAADHPDLPVPDRPRR